MIKKKNLIVNNNKIQHSIDQNPLIDRSINIFKDWHRIFFYR